ncbi:MAG: ATPase, T2SS/T4P/T4SS family, partial [Pseudomonadota bacterium]
MFRRYQRVQDAPTPPKLEVDPQEKALRAKQRQEKERRSLSSAEVAEIQRDAKRQEKLLDVRMELHKRVLETLNLGALEKASEQELRREIGVITREGLRENGVVLNASEAEQLNQDLYDEITGLGPLEVLLKDESVNDILVNGPLQVFVERNGRLELTPIRFKDDRHLLRVIDKIVSAVGRRVDESHPYVDARLQDGSRFNAMVPP